MSRPAEPLEIEAAAIGAPADPPAAIGAARIVALLILAGILATSVPFMVGRDLKAGVTERNRANDDRIVLELAYPKASFVRAAGDAPRLWAWLLMPAFAVVTLLWERLALARAAARRRTLSAAGGHLRCALLGAAAIAALLATFAIDDPTWRPALGATLASGAALVLVGCAAAEAIASPRRGWIRAL